EVLKLARLVKVINPRAVIIVGGFHATVLPDDFVFEDSPVDFIIRGEGELPLYLLIRDSIGRKRMPVVISGPVLDTFDDFPVVGFELFNKYEGRLNTDELQIYLSRGCSHDCSFCISRHATCGMKKYRVMPVSFVSRQIARLEGYGMRRLTISDPLFGLGRAWFEKVTDLLGQRNTPYRVKVEMHVDLMNDKRIERCLKNKIDLVVGFESASLQMLHLMNKTIDPAKYILKTKKIMSSYNDSSQELLLNVLFGHPGESKSTLDETFGFLYDSMRYMNSTTPKASLFRLYPGTPVFEDQAFYHQVFGTIFYDLGWWYRDCDQSLSPVIIDPSRGFPLEQEIEYIHEQMESFLGLSAREGTLTIMKKIAVMKYASKLKGTYENLHSTIQAMKASIQSLKNTI
nr:radical SAM protein [Candidatus Sigynarchaeota archaeon]